MSQQNQNQNQQTNPFPIPIVLIVVLILVALAFGAGTTFSADLFLAFKLFIFVVNVLAFAAWWYSSTS